MLKLVVPKGSLERATFDLFEAADLRIKRSSDVDYRASVNDPRIEDVRILRPQEIPMYVAEGLFDFGITGRDWIEEQGSQVESVGELAYSKNTGNPIRVVLAVGADSQAQSIEQLDDGIRVSTEFPNLTRRYFLAHGINPHILPSYGATEAKVPDIADAVVDLTETGRALRAAGLRIIETLLVSRTELIANPVSWADPDKQHAMKQIFSLLTGTLAARGRVLLKLNVDDVHLKEVIALVPSLKSPTVSQLWNDEGYAVETVVDKEVINTLIPALKDAGATGILELPLGKIIP